MSLIWFAAQKNRAVIATNLCFFMFCGRRYIAIIGPAACASVDVNPAMMANTIA